MARLCVFAVALLATLSSGATMQVSMVDSRFVPDTADVVIGDTVVWTNNGVSLHTSTSGVNGVYDSIWDSGTSSSGGTFRHVFTTAGSFHYFCRFHYLSGMTGLVRVSSGGIGQESQVAPARPLAVGPNPFRATAIVRYETGARSAAQSGRLWAARVCRVDARLRGTAETSVAKRCRPASTSAV